MPAFFCCVAISVYQPQLSGIYFPEISPYAA